MASVTLNPSGYTGSSNMSVSTSTNAISNAYTNTSSTTYAQLTPSSTSTVGYLYLTFTTNSIPSNAIINSITAQVKIRINNANRVNNCSVQLYTNTTAKGSSTSVTSTSSSNIATLTPGTWTRSELDNLRLRVAGQKASSNNTGYIYVYGANITIDYTVPVYYNVTATSAVSGISVTPSSSSVLQGDNIEITFDVNDMGDYIVTDNDVDVTSSLVRHSYPGGGTVSKTATSFTTGFSGGTSMNFYTSSSSTGNNFNYAVNHTAESPGSTSSGSGSWTYVKENGSSTSNTGYADFAFDFSDIPENATITQVQVKCYGAVESASQSTSHADITLYSGSTQKGTMQKFTSSTNGIITISSPGTWTRAELQNAKLRFAVGYYGGHIFGITWSVTYTTPTGYYYTYTLNNVQASHVIVLDLAGVFIPPEEDPQYTYVPITISSINATTDPPTGTTRVIQGTNQTITITPSDPQLTLALDNGVDITSQLQGGVPNNTYTVTTQVTGASYGFNLNSSTGYYVSTNNGVAKSASVARLNMDFESSCLVTIQYINYAEANYDYGMFGKLDTAVATDGLTANSSSGTSSPSDSTSNYQLAMASNSSSAQTISYNVPSGQHYIDIKYGKDDATNSNNDTLQWKVLSVEATSSSGSYTYTLTKVQEKHSLIFVFGNVSYYYITSSGPSGMKLFPDGQTVVLAGDSYKIIVVPQNVSDTVTLTDNNINVTNNLEKEEGFDKYNNPAVSYTYQLSNIQAAHTLVFNITSATANLFIKRNGNWVSVVELYVKVNGNWVKQSSLSYLSDNNITSIIQGS